jgi:hypothetical protein
MSFKKGDLVRIVGTGHILHTGIVMRKHPQPIVGHLCYYVYLTKRNLIKPFRESRLERMVKT